MSAHKVHIRHSDGTPWFNRLYDDGSLVFQFESGHGFVDRLDVERFAWQVVPGWLDDADEEPFLAA